MAFLKRKPFEDEREYRIIFESQTESLRAHPISINLDSITKVTLSPWLPEAVATSVVRIIQCIPGCDRLNVNRSSLVDNSKWREVIKAAEPSVSRAETKPANKGRNDAASGIRTRPHEKRGIFLSNEPDINELMRACLEEKCRLTQILVAGSFRPLLAGSW